MNLALQIALASVATSYLTLGIFAGHKARCLWWEYTIIMVVLSVVSLWLMQKERKNGRRHPDS
jgi:hypothetical protein